MEIDENKWEQVKAKYTKHIDYTRSSSFEENTIYVTYVDGKGCKVKALVQLTEAVVESLGVSRALQEGLRIAHERLVYFIENPPEEHK